MMNSEEEKKDESTTSKENLFFENSETIDIPEISPALQELIEGIDRARKEESESFVAFRSVAYSRLSPENKLKKKERTKFLYDLRLGSLIIAEFDFRFFFLSDYFLEKYKDESESLKVFNSIINVLKNREGEWMLDTLEKRISNRLSSCFSPNQETETNISEWKSFFNETKGSGLWERLHFLLRKVMEEALKKKNFLEIDTTPNVRFEPFLDEKLLDKITSLGRLTSYYYLQRKQKEIEYIRRELLSLIKRYFIKFSRTLFFKELKYDLDKAIEDEQLILSYFSNENLREIFDWRESDFDWEELNHYKKNFEEKEVERKKIANIDDCFLKEQAKFCLMYKNERESYYRKNFLLGLAYNKSIHTFNKCIDIFRRSEVIKEAFLEKIDCLKNEYLSRYSNKFKLFQEGFESDENEFFFDGELERLFEENETRPMSSMAVTDSIASPKKNDDSDDVFVPVDLPTFAEKTVTEKKATDYKKASLFALIATIIILIAVPLLAFFTDFGTWISGKKKKQK